MLPEVQQQLSRIQSAFSLLLTESDQFLQECAAKGVSTVYSVGMVPVLWHIFLLLIS